jgi:hypothetical protein
LSKNGSQACSRGRQGNNSYKFTRRPPAEPKTPPATRDPWKYVKGRSIYGGDRNVNIAELERQTGLTSIHYRLEAGWSPELAQVTAPMSPKIRCRLARVSKKGYPRY